MTLPEHIQDAIARCRLTVALHMCPPNLDSDLLLVRLHEVVRDEYSPLDPWQQETISLKEITPLDPGSDVGGWRARFLHSIDLDDCSISDKRESSMVELTIDHDFSLVSNVRWKPLRRFRTQIEHDE